MPTVTAVKTRPKQAAQPAAPQRLLGGAVSWISRLAIRLHLRETVLCPECSADLTFAPRYRRVRVCDGCGHHFSLSASARIDLLADPHSFVELPSSPASTQDRELREAVITGTARVADHLIVLIVFDFRFAGGTMSVAAGEAIAGAFEHAAQHHLPIVAITSTGGVRIQEGIPALLQMARTTLAVEGFQKTHAPFIAILANPTTGGVYASFASLADITLAEPGAVVGFAGPRVSEFITHVKLPPGSHRALAAYESGMLDGVVARDDLRELVARLLALSAPAVPAQTAPVSLAEDHTPAPGKSAAEVLALARHPDRPTARAYIERMLTDWVELHGDRLTGDDCTVVGGLARLGDQSLVLVAQEGCRGDAQHGTGPGAYRKAERLIHLAARLNLPLVTLVDSTGADPSDASERQGIASAIAHCLAALLQVPVPTVAALIGEGTSGGALALAAADRVLMQEYATFMVISPEGAAAIRHGDAARAAEMAETLGITVRDLLPRGIVDRAVSEPEGGAHVDIETAAAMLKTELAAALAGLLAQSPEERLAARRARYRSTR